MLTNFFKWLSSLFSSNAAGAPDILTVTRKIKVKGVRAADPSLIITLVPEDGGTFPPFVQANAAITSNTGGQYQATGSSQAGGLSVTIVAYFTDSNFPNETTLAYQISINISQNGSINSWTPFDGTVDNASGSVPT